MQQVEWEDEYIEPPVRSRSAFLAPPADLDLPELAVGET
jgi:hypothetical protein